MYKFSFFSMRNPLRRLNEPFDESNGFVPTKQINLEFLRLILRVEWWSRLYFNSKCCFCSLPFLFRSFLWNLTEYPETSMAAQVTTGKSILLFIFFVGHHIFKSPSPFPRLLPCWLTHWLTYWKYNFAPPPSRRRSVRSIGRYVIIS